MRTKVARAAGLTSVAAGVLALASAAAGPALASSTVDTGGTASVAVQHSVLKGLAKAGLVLLPTGFGTASYVKGQEKITLSVSGGDATFVGATGTLELAGGLELIDGASGKSVTVTKLAFSYDTASITGVAGRHHVTIGDVAGSINGTASAGPPASQTFTATAIVLTKSGAKFLDSQLRTTYFKAGQDIGGFATTYDVGSAS